MCVDLLLRCAIIAAAASLACAWMQAFCEPWPLVDAFVLAPTAEVQVVRSLGVSPQLLIRTRCALQAVCAWWANRFCFRECCFFPSKTSLAVPF